MDHEVTRLLFAWTSGEEAALTRLMPLLYEELRGMAESYLRGEPSGRTLQPTALVHEAYLRLVAQRLPDWQNRSHFFGVASQLMRQILVDSARVRQAAKRGGDVQKISLEDYSVSNRGLRSGLVGTPEKVTERLQEFADAGVDLVLLQSSPQLEEMERFSAQVMRPAR